MPNDYQDQGALDQPQQPTDPQPGAYTTPGVVPPDQQQETVNPPGFDDNPQLPGGGAADTPDDATPAAPAPTPPAPARPVAPAAPAPVSSPASTPSGDSST